MQARGIFSWPAGERRSDRYGVITLNKTDFRGEAFYPLAIDMEELAALALKKVQITARVLETRDSGHIGDLFREIYPSRPAVGEVIDLGRGTLLMVPEITDLDDEGTVAFGLGPDDMRDTDWIDPHKLYRLHDQTVELTIEQPS